MRLGVVLGIALFAAGAVFAKSAQEFQAVVRLKDQKGGTLKARSEVALRGRIVLPGYDIEAEAVIPKGRSQAVLTFPIKWPSAFVFGGEINVVPASRGACFSSPLLIGTHRLAPDKEPVELETYLADCAPETDLAAPPARLDKGAAKNAR